MGLVAALAMALMTAMVVVAPTAEARVLTTSIKGVVLDARTGKGVAGVRVFVMEKYYPWGQGVYGQDWAYTAAAEAVTGKGGTYTVKLDEAGTYRVFFVPSDLTRYAMEAYPNAAVAEVGDDIVVKYGKTTSGISVKLDPSNRIAGRIYSAESRWTDGEDDESSVPLPGVTVRVCFQSLVLIACNIRNAEQGDTVPLGEAITQADGSYSIPGFKPFRFFAWANPEGGDTGYDPALSSLMIDIDGSAFPEGVKYSEDFLQSTDLANIKGRVVDESNNGLEGKTFQVWEVDVTEPYPAFQPKECTVTTGDGGVFPVTPEDARCLNLLEPAAVLWFPGDDYHQGEFYDHSPQDWDWSEIEVRWGWTNDIGDWVLTANQ